MGDDIEMLARRHALNDPEVKRMGRDVMLTTLLLFLWVVILGFIEAPAWVTVVFGFVTMANMALGGHGYLFLYYRARRRFLDETV